MAIVIDIAEWKVRKQNRLAAQAPGIWVTNYGTPANPIYSLPEILAKLAEYRRNHGKEEA